MFNFVDYLIVAFILVITILIGFTPTAVKSFKKYQLKRKENKRLEQELKRRQSTNHETFLFNDIDIHDASNVIKVQFDNNDYEDIIDLNSPSINISNNSSKNIILKNGNNIKSSPSFQYNNLSNTATQSKNNEEPKANFFLNLISLVVGFQTPISIVGLPIEFYFYGFKSFQITLSIILSPILISLFFVPFLYKIKSKSIYDYLNDKFDGHMTVKNLAISLGILFQFLFASMVLFSTSISITQIVSLNYESIQLWHVSLFLGLFSAFLALLGLESVILANFVQYILMTLCNLLIIYLGIKNYSTDSISKNVNNSTLSFMSNLNSMWNATVTTGRSDFLVFNESFRIRYTFWNCFIGLIFNALPSYCLTQQSYMRIKQAKSAKSAQYLTLSILPISVLNLSLITLLGFIMFSYNYKCGDPLSLNLISSQNQLFAKFLTQFFDRYYGLLGLYIALVLSSGLGTLSSVLKALSVTLSQDVFIRIINMIKISRKKRLKSTNKMNKENSFTKQRRLSDKQNEFIYEEELITIRLTNSNGSGNVDKRNLKKNKKKLIKKYLKKNYITNKPTKKLVALLIVISALILSLISIYLNEIPGTITSIGFSLINCIHGPILFIYLCARFNDFSIKRYKYALYRSTESKLRNFRLNHIDILISCLLSIVFVEFLFFGQLYTKENVNGYYDSEKIVMNNNLDEYYKESFYDDNLNKFCRHSNLTINNMMLKFNKTYSTSSSILDPIQTKNGENENNNNNNNNNLNILHHLFSISFNWYSFIGFFTCLFSIFILNLLRLLVKLVCFVFFKKQ
jgi:hypothetical protein